MTEPVLKTLSRGTPPEDLDRVRDGADDSVLGDRIREVERAGAPIPISAFAELVTRVDALRGQWAERTKSDAWLAPRLHWALRLTRVEASDRGVWAYLANVLAPDYVRWRWSGKGDVVVAERWDGPRHKQALARLWWGAELFRDGPSYRPVEKLFANQDFPNSYIHRVFTRSRPLAVSLVETLVTASGSGGGPTSDEINDVARKVNFYTAARSIEAATGFHRDDASAYRTWVNQTPGPGVDFGPLPMGPDDGKVARESRRRGFDIGSEICALAGLGN